MKKSLRYLITLTSAGLLLSLAAPVHHIIAQEDDAEETTEMVETEDVTEAEEVEETEEAEEDYAFEVESDVINADEEVIGTAHFTEDQDGNVELHLELSGLEEGEYGMHIHEVGLATAPTFEDAGSHFNPTDVEHGTESETGPHLGDLPNLVVDENGEVDEVYQLEGVTLDPEGENTLNSVDGTTLIIHTAADDYETQPTGDAGERQAAAIIFAPLEDSEYYQAEEETEEAETVEEDTEEAETTEEEAE